MDFVVIPYRHALLPSIAASSLVILFCIGVCFQWRKSAFPSPVVSVLAVHGRFRPHPSLDVAHQTNTCLCDRACAPPVPPQFHSSQAVCSLHIQFPLSPFFMVHCRSAAVAVGDLGLNVFLHRFLHPGWTTSSTWTRASSVLHLKHPSMGIPDMLRGFWKVKPCCLLQLAGAEEVVLGAGAVLRGRHRVLPNRRQHLLTNCAGQIGQRQKC